jgi:ribosomal protein S18 acetylase RimI-like enzyme
VIREKTVSDSAALDALWTERYGSSRIVSRGHVYSALELPGFVAADDSKMLGAVTYARLLGEIEVVTLDSLAAGRGFGTALLDAVASIGRAERLGRLFLITTNDNVHAIDFYRRRGWRIRSFYEGAVDEARKKKPEIPLIGENGIPIHDEIEFELPLSAPG